MGGNEFVRRFAGGRTARSPIVCWVRLRGGAASRSLFFRSDFLTVLLPTAVSLNEVCLEAH